MIKITPVTWTLFLIMMLPGIGFFFENNITISSMLSSILAFFLIIGQIIEKNYMADD